MRNRIVEELKVEKLTTRRGHHRKPEHRDSIQLNFNRMFNRVFNRVNYTLNG